MINKAIANLIRDEKTIQIRSSIQTGSAHGMMLLEQSLNELVKAGKITKEVALELAEEKKLETRGMPKDDLREMMTQILKEHNII